MSPNLSAADKFQRALAEYSVWASRRGGALIEDRARKVRFGLYKRFRAIAKTPAELREEIAGLGYAIRRRAGGSGKSGAAGRTLDTESEIRARIRSLKFLSVSFLFREWRTAPAGRDRRYVARTREAATIGAAALRTASGRTAPYAQLTSLLEGAVEQNRQRRIVDAELNAQAADMAAYVARKHREQLQRAFRTTYAVAIRA